ncbi:MAG: hypothetical protein PHO66_07995 [Eubacteriales bacterium]|nr:hypothetical protein [Eubacteriales bacterium]
MEERCARQINRKFYGKFFHFGRWLARRVVPRMRVEGWENVNGSPAIFVGRHMDMYGPVTIMAWASIPRLRAWVLYKFMDKQTCYHHYATYTMMKRRGYPALWSKILARILSWLVPPLCRSLRAIPVYRGSKDIIRTMKQSVEALEQGDSILVMPEIDYVDRDDAVGELYAGFIQLGRLYCAKTRCKSIAFVPVYSDMQRSAVCIRQPVVFHADQPFQQERIRVMEQLKHGLSGAQ